MQITGTASLQLQLDVQRCLHEQWELQKNLQLCIEEQSRQLRMMLDHQQQRTSNSRFKNQNLVGTTSPDEPEQILMTLRFPSHKILIKPNSHLSPFCREQCVSDFIY